MKYIITELQSAFIKRRLNESDDKPMNKFNRDSNPDKGKYGEMIEKIALSYFNNPDDVCDILCIQIPNEKYDEEYILLILMSYSISEKKLKEYIKNFIPTINIMVSITPSNTCKD
jgi:hypothetical protein